jgi:2-oxoglutarate dehydrogenase E1 component
MPTLIDEGVITKPTNDAMKADWRKHLEEEFDIDNYKPNKADWLDGKWSGLKATKDDDDPRAARPGSDGRLKTLGNKLTAVPDGFNIHRTIKRVMDNRAKMISAGENRLGHSGVAGICLVAG